MSATVKLILDVRRIKKNQKYPVKLQVIYQRKSKMYSTVFDLSKDDFSKISCDVENTNLGAIDKQLSRVGALAEDFIFGMNKFSFLEFKRRFIWLNKIFKQHQQVLWCDINNSTDTFDYSPYYKRFPILLEKVNKETISFVYGTFIRTLLKEERIGTAINYQDSYNSLKRFGGDCVFMVITKSFLITYEKWMLNRGRTKTTVGIRVRCLRSIFNEAHEMGIIKKENHYPFGRRRYKIPNGCNVKKALELSDIRAIYYYQPENVIEEKARDYWLFSYFANGINPKDLVYLKYKNIQDGYLVFTRIKTAGVTCENPRLITAYITEDMQRIINRWGSKRETSNTYLFPVMKDFLNPLEEYNIVPTFTRFINDNMANIREALGIQRKITTIVSRHSFSTQLKRSGVSTEYIQEALGHMDKRTTENYLGSFGKEIKKEFADKLLDFKNA